jgi:hypothetical protein
VIIKYNEAQSIRKTYEQILKRLNVFYYYCQSVYYILLTIGRAVELRQPA